MSHTHSYASDYTADEMGHWYKCTGCEEVSNYANHIFDNACDPDCSVCGYSRETKHTYAESWKNSETNHWRECTGCGLTADEEAHVPGTAATETTAQTCTICGYVIAPALDCDGTNVPTESTPITNPAIAAQIPTDKPDYESTNILWIIIIAAVGIAIGGGVAFIVSKKKR